MPDNGPGDGRIERLRERWQADPSSRLFLQLAEEYRRSGQMDEAVAILEKGLQHHPNYLSAKVALARCHLEMGKPAEAAQVLRIVVEQDPTQLVANKLLVEAYVAMDEDQLAGQALDAYMALNRSDPEIEQLDQRIEAMRSDRDLGAEPSGAQPFEVGLGDEGEGEDGAEAITSSAQRADANTVSREEEPVKVSVAPRDPFPGLYRHRERVEWMRSLAAQGLFPVASAASAEPPAATGELRTAMPTAASLEAGPREARVEAESGTARGGNRETVTLGQLYLDQGHAGEAAEIFRRVVDRDPANVVALEGLAEAERRVHGAHDTGSPELHAQEGLNARKVRRLREYLTLLRRGAGKNVS